jgi:hypothetical protein
MLNIGRSLASRMYLSKHNSYLVKQDITLEHAVKQDVIATNNNLLIKDHTVVVKQDVTFREVTLKCPNPSPWI